jgi:anti-sigma B factor antagonist
MVTIQPVDNQLVILEPDGRLTEETVHEFKRTVSKWVRRGWRDLILDLGSVTYLDSAGIGALASLYTSSQRRGGRAVFVNVAGKNRELLRVTKLLTVFEVYDSTADAKRSFGSSETALA